MLILCILCVCVYVYFTFFSLIISLYETMHLHASVNCHGLLASTSL